MKSGMWLITPPFNSANAKRPKQEILCIDLDQCDDRGRKCHDGQIDTATAQEAFADRLDRRISEILRGEEKTAEAETGPLTLAFRRPVIRHHEFGFAILATLLPFGFRLLSPDLGRDFFFSRTIDLK